MTLLDTRDVIRANKDSLIYWLDQPPQKRLLKSLEDAKLYHWFIVNMAREIFTYQKFMYEKGKKVKR